MFGADVERLRSLQGVKWTMDPSDVLPAWVADMDFEPAEPIKSAIRELVDRGDLGYNMAVREALIPAWLDWQGERHGYRPPEDECRINTGTLHSLEIAMELETEPGDGVVVFSPIYYPFTAAILDSGRRIVDVPLDGPDYRLDPDRFEAAIDATTKVVLWCNPHNPLGRVFDPDEIAAFAEVAARHGLLVISDEVWGDLAYDGEHLPLYREAESLRPRLVTLSSASKAFNIAGLRCSLAHIGDPTLRKRIDGFAQHFFGGPSNLGTAATIAAWRHAGSWLDKIKAQLVANRDHLVARANALPGVSMQPTQGTYLAWLDFSQSAIAADPAGQIFETGRVSVHAGDKFSERAAGFVRLNFATSPEILDEIVDRIAMTIQEAST